MTSRIDVVVMAGIAEFVIHGAPTIAALSRVLDDYYAGAPVKHAIWDFLGGSMNGLSASDFRALAESSARHAGARGTGAKTAVLVNGDPEMLLIRSFVAHAERYSPINFGGFASRSDARVWLTVETSAVVCCGLSTVEPSRRSWPVARAG